MKDNKIKDIVGGVKTYFVEMPKKRRTTLLVVLAVVVIAATGLTILMNMNASAYKVLYSGMNQEETNSLYSLLSEKGVSVQMNPRGELLVPTGQYDALLLELAGQGYPKSALSYDIFTSQSGLTATETQRKQALIYQLQNRVQDTLARIKGVKTATVTINIPDTSDYVWQQTEEKENAQASVLLNLDYNNELSPEQVSSIRRLVASGCPNMTEGDVTVVDAATSLELVGADEAGADSLNSSRSLELEQLAQSKVEENIKRLLEPRYGKDGVVAAAKVTLNFDKMITEQNEMQEKPDGGGNITHTEGDFSVNGEKTIGGLVGEEDNTDIPGNGYVNGADQEGLTNYSFKTDYEYSYVKTQVEKGNAKIDRATISVMVNEQNLTQALRTELTNLISNGVDIPTGQIAISTFNVPAVSEAPIETQAPSELDVLLNRIPWWVWLIAAAVVILAVTTIIVLAILRKKAKKKALEEKKRLEKEAMLKANNEIAEYKKQLSEAAKGDTNDVDQAIMGEVKDFAKTNPEITANLIRNWLKESS